MAEGFAFAMKQLSKGGGPAKIRDRLREEYQKKYGNISDEELSMKAKDEMVYSYTVHIYLCVAAVISYGWLIDFFRCLISRVSCVARAWMSSAVLRM